MGKMVKHHPFKVEKPMVRTHEKKCFLFVSVCLDWIELDYSIFSRGISPQNWQTGVGVASCCLHNGFEMSPSGGFHKLGYLQMDGL